MASVSTIAPPVAFNTAFERLNEIVSKDDARSFNSTRMEDVWTTARDIERHLESRRSLRGFRRIQPFLAGIEQYSKVVEVICNGTPYMPYLWAPIKLLLQIAQGHIAALEKLIDAYAMIGEAMPRFDRLSAAFKDDLEFQQVMGHFYEDILEFHRRAYMFFRRRAWKIVFDSLWKTFHLRFQGILENLRKHRDLIDAEANAIDIAEARAWRSTQLDHIRQWRADRAYYIDKTERERLASQTREAAAWFGANEDQEDVFAKFSKACDGTESHWILKDSIVLSWLGQGGRANPVIWLNGKPGAGKSVICSKLVEHVQEKTDMAVIYYFCPHHQASQTSASEVLRSFATQLLTGNASLAPYILETFANNGQKPTKKNLGMILEKMITSVSSLRIIVDGLDECLQEDQDEIIQDLLRIKGPVSGACKILLSSRKHRSISRWLHSKPTIRLDDNTDNVNSTISSFIYPRLQSLRDHFSPAIVDGLGDLLLAKANGMFLWIRLVMFTLADLHFESDVLEAMETLPEDLEAVYERILLRLCGDGKNINQRTTIRILQWMLVAERPLKRSELESGIILHGQVSKITTSTRPRGDVLSLCYPILEAEDDPGGLVNFVHFTAQEYLRNTDKFSFLQPQQAQLTVSLSCVLYLQSSLTFFDPRVAEEEQRSNVTLCLHELHLYAIDHWVDHLLALSKTLGSHPGGNGLQLLLRGLERLTDMHKEVAALQGSSIRNERGSDSTQREHSWQPLEVSPATRSLLDRALVYRERASSDERQPNIPPLSSDELLDPPLFSFIRDRYQIIVEELMERKEPADKALFDFKVRQNSGAFLCHNQNCPRAVQGFRTSELRQEHAKSHRPRFQCVHAPCGFFGTTFNTRAAMNKHATQYHDEETTASVPDSLIRKSRVSPKDRSLFTFTEVKTKRKTEDFSPPLISVTKNPQLAAGHLLQQQQYLHAQQLLQQEQQQQQQQQQLYAQQQQRHQQLQQQLQQQQLQQQHQQQLQQQIQQQQIQRIQAAQNRLLSNNENGNNESQPKELLFQPPMYPSMQPEFPSTNPPLPSSLPPVRYLETNYTDKDSLNASASQETEPLLPSIDFADSRMGKISLEDYLDNLDASVSQETKALLPGIDSADSSLDPLLAVGPSLEGYVPDSSLFGEDWSKTNSPQPTPEEPRPQLPPLTAGLPQRSTFSDLLQVANTGHLTAKSVPPVADTSTQRSPFRESSQYAEDQGVPHDWAAPSRQEQELGANAQADASRASPLPSITSLQRPPDSPIMSDPKLMSLMEGVKKRFWHARRHLQQDEIELQWAPRTARSSSIDYPVPGEIFPPYEEVEPLFMGLEDTT